MIGYQALRTTAAWLDLSHRGKLRAIGEDRARLLHAMSTNSIADLPAGRATYAFFLSAQGRILADANVINTGDALWLDTEPEVAEKLREHLDRYIIADDVELEDKTSEWVEIAIEGPDSIESASQVGWPVPAQRYAIEEWHSGFVLRVASTGPDGLRAFLPAEQRNLVQLPDIPQGDAAAARLVRLENGLPRYGDEVTERYLVQETQQLQAVHPNKGCYLGQEIVERVRSRGQVHRLLTPIRIQSNEPPAPGTKLIADGKEAGEISSALYSPGLGEVVGLAYIRTEPAHSKPEMMVAGTEPPVRAYIR